ncbi:hypothetical protein ACQJBY_036887 [Aegilops geniculata]
MAAMWSKVIAILLLFLRLARLSSSSSMVFELRGNVYPIRQFFVTMSIGEPAKPYFLHVDTGSGLTWLECDAPRQSFHKVPHEVYRPRPSNRVPCEDERCAVMHKDLGTVHDCTEHPDQCDYDINYKDGYSSMGVLLTDKFSLPMRNDRPNLAFGCGYDQQGEQEELEVDGILGIGRGTGDLVSQLKQQGLITENVVGHCLSSHGGGYLFFGGDVPSTGVTWLPMVQEDTIYYSPGKVTWNLDVLLKYELSKTPRVAVFDSCSSYSYVHKDTYEQLIQAVDVTLLDSTLQKVSDDPELTQCWRYNQPIQSVDDVKHEFEPLELTFTHGASQVTLDIPPENYIVVTERGNVCLGILNGSEHGMEELNIIGDITMQNHLVVYDNERARIGWVRASCDIMPGSAPIIASRL